MISATTTWFFFGGVVYDCVRKTSLDLHGPDRTGHGGRKGGVRPRCVSSRGAPTNEFLPWEGRSNEVRPESGPWSRCGCRVGLDDRLPVSGEGTLSGTGRIIVKERRTD